jgi:hypothetical protein
MLGLRFRDVEDSPGAIRVVLVSRRVDGVLKRPTYDQVWRIDV